MRFRGSVVVNKRNSITRLFTINCNGFRPGPTDKIQQLIRDNKDKEINSILISSADTRQCSHTKTCINTKIQVYKDCFIMNSSDSREVLEEGKGKIFLKGVTFTVI